jgi:WG repeat protein
MRKQIVAFLLFFGLIFCGHALGQKREPRRLFIIGNSEGHGFMDKAGRIVVKPRNFEEAWPFSDGLAAVALNGKWGFIDETGEVVIKPQFWTVSSFSEGLAEVSVFDKKQKSAKYGYIDKTGRYVIEPQFGIAFSFSDGMAQVSTLDSRRGYVDKSGHILYLDPKFTWNENFSEGLAAVGYESGWGKKGYIDKTGRVVIDTKYDKAGDFSEGLACVGINRKHGYIDAAGNTIISFQFDDCSAFSEGMAAVRINNRWGYIDRSGQMIVQPQYVEAKEFSEGLAAIRIPSRYDQTGETEDGYIITEGNGPFGYIDRTGKVVIAPVLTQVSKFDGGLAAVNAGDDYVVSGNWDKWGYIDKTGKFIWKNFNNKLH